MCRTLCVIIFLSASGCGANVAKVKYRQNVQGIIGLLGYAQIKNPHFLGKAVSALVSIS